MHGNTTPYLLKIALAKIDRRFFGRVYYHTSKMPSINRTAINAATPALAANGVSSVRTDVTAIPMPNT